MRARPQGTRVTSELARLLRSARTDAGISQLELSLRLGVSQRHVSFVEQARARPSRELLLVWLRELGARPAQLNAALLLAGHAPLSADRASARESEAAALRTIALHEPNPGLVFDADWHIVRMNRPAQWLCGVLMPPWVLDDERPDMLAILAHPEGWLSRAREPVGVAAALLGQLRTEQWLHPGLRTRIDALEHTLVARYPLLAAAPRRDPSATLFSVRLDTPLGLLSFCAVQSTVGLPHEAAGHKLRVELWYPDDAATARQVAARGGGVSRTALACG